MDMLPIGTIVQIISKEEVDSLPKDDRGRPLLPTKFDGHTRCFADIKMLMCDCQARITMNYAMGDAYLYDLHLLDSDQDLTQEAWSYYFSPDEFHVVKYPPNYNSIPTITFDQLMSVINQ